MQRRDCFDAVRHALGVSDAADLEGELSRFAQWLGSPSGSSEISLRTPPSAWRTTDGVHFDTVIAQTSREEGRRLRICGNAVSGDYPRHVE